MSDLSCDVAIIGGGLSGLAACFLAQDKGLNVQLFESLPRFGGRIDSIRSHDLKQPIGDLGPTWVWPAYQPTISRWLDILGIEIFEQYDLGNAVFDTQNGPLFQPFPSQHGMVRLGGGTQSLVDQIIARLDPKCLHNHSAVQVITHHENGFSLSVAGKKHKCVQADKIIIAAPLRVVADQINWNGLLDAPTLDLMRQSPTWMAQQAKATIIYTHPFWRDKNLSGRVASHIGPLVEVHDHSNADASIAALFGFVGWPPHMRQEHDLKTAIIDQLVRCFGDKAKHYTQLAIQDWSLEPSICTQTDIDIASGHPTQLPEHIRQGFCDNRLLFAVSETAKDHPGLIDGALESAERAVRQLALSL